MTKRLIEIDDRLLHAAREALGVDTYKDTVSRALERVIADRATGPDTTAMLAAFSLATVDLSDADVMTDAWQ